MKSIAKNSFFNILYTVLNLCFPLITSMYVSRILGPDGIGRVSYVQNDVSYFVMFAMLGIHNYALREIANIQQNERKKNQLFTNLIIINTISTLITLIIYLMLIINISLFQNEFSLYVACGSLIFLNFFNIDWFYQGQEEYVYIVCRSIVIKFISIIAILLFVKSKDDCVLYAWITSVGTAGNYLLNILNVRKRIKLDFSNIKLKKHLKSILIIFVGVFCASIYAKIDISMLRIMTSEVYVGYYSYAHRIIDLICTIAVSVTTVFLPRLSFYYRNDRVQFEKLLKLGIHALIFLSIPMAVGIFLLAPNLIIILYGEGFLGASIVVRIFSILIIVKSIGNLVCYQLVICTCNEKERIPAAILASVSNVILNLILIPYVDIIGAALASVISEFIVNGYQFIKLRKVINFSFDTKALVQAIISTIGMTLVICIVLIFDLSSIVLIFLSFTFGGLTYLIINKLLNNEFEEMLLKKIVKNMK